MSRSAFRFPKRQATAGCTADKLKDPHQHFDSSTPKCPSLRTQTTSRGVESRRKTLQHCRHFRSLQLCVNFRLAQLAPRASLAGSAASRPWQSPRAHPDESIHAWHDLAHSWHLPRPKPLPVMVAPFLPRCAVLQLTFRVSNGRFSMNHIDTIPV